MRIGFLSTRFGGPDGVSLETAKLAKILESMGHEIRFCAGEYEGDSSGLIIPKMSFNHPEVRELGRRAFRGGTKTGLSGDIVEFAEELKREITGFVAAAGVEVLCTQNVQSLPMNLPLGVALGKFIAETGFPVLAHHHDFWWERERFLASGVPEILRRYFPPDLDSIRHLVINTIAGEELCRRKKLRGVLLPNVYDFDNPPASEGDDFIGDLRGDLGMAEDEVFFLQPTRVVPRKWVEKSIELVSRLSDFSDKLIITGPAGDEGMDYLHYLRRKAREKHVDLRYVADEFGPNRSQNPKTYSIWDAYLEADFVTYPSRKEGFGNALLETIYYRLPALVNRYPVYEKDISPLGFDFVEIEGTIDSSAVSSATRLLADEDMREKTVNKNYRIGREHFSFSRAEGVLTDLLRELETV